ncbi:hypothetical protein PpBr36_00677 [Pyricularia pennisetigena]|uniref:hypothetical protein n=1 Tax=Pyricularia pennisetigena TaxID=1578925 RepID=UPI001153C100|nr:hypothetical protein PpBr36_00677 [Pyricularia pennisetigena]TLS28568.1 hypothetical protein PpBr36_00677 [Pyricularia pennisetigena]
MFKNPNPLPDLGTPSRWRQAYRNWKYALSQLQGIIKQFQKSNRPLETCPSAMSRLKVAVLDDYLDSSSSYFGKLDSSIFEVTTFKDTLPPYSGPETPAEAKDELARRLEPFSVICTMRERTPFPAELINRLPNLKLLLTTGVRNASLDLTALRQRGIPVAGAKDKKRGKHDSNAITTGTDSTTEHCVAMIMGLARGLVRDHNAVQAGLWQTGYAVGLSGKTFATLGLGRLGTAVSRIMNTAFGMRVIAWSENLTQEKADEQAKGAGLAVENGDGKKTFEVVSREELFRTADVLSIHLVLSQRTRGLVTEKDLSLMKRSAMLVNTSRAGLVVTQDLLKVLENGAIRGAAIDVFDLEPLPTGDVWRTTKWGEDGRSQVLLTPHMGYVEEQTLRDWYEMQVENILRWHNGEELLMPL